MSQPKGWMEVTFKMPCDLSDVQPTRTWVSELLRKNPDLTGWPFFVDLWNAPRNPQFKPRRTENGIWEARLFDDEGMDYWRIDGRNGLFFAARAFEDDTSPRSPAPGEVLDFGIVILRVAELVMIAATFGNFLCRDKCSDGAVVSMSFKWTGLKDRTIASWANPERYLHEVYTNTGVDTCSFDVNVPLATSNDEVVILTEQVVNELFGCFDGWEAMSMAVGQLVDKLTRRQL